MNTIRFALILVVGLMSGCELVGAGDDDRIHSGNSTVSGEMQGRAVKGVLGQALVQAYAVEAGGLRWVAETTTDNDGYYSLEVSGIGGPVLLEVTPAAGALMRCDAVSGCGDKTFGEEVELAKDFRLTTLILPEEVNHDRVSITPLTHLMAEWAREMDTVPAADMVKLARARVAGVLSVAPDFAFHNVPDITDPAELAESEASSVGVAVMAAAVQEASATWGSAFLKDLSHRFNAHGGQMPQTGDGATLANLLDAAVRVARGVTGHDALAGMASSLEFRRDHMAPGVTAVHERLLEKETPAFAKARGALVGIAAGLDRLGLNEKGDFASIRHEEMAWMMRPGTAEVYDWLYQATMMASLTSILGDIVYGPETIIVAEGVSFTRNYLENRGVLTLDVVEPGLSVDLRIEMPLARQVLAEGQPLEYHALGSISSGEMVLNLDSEVSLDPLDTNVMPLIIALDTMLISGHPLTWEDFARESDEYVENRHGLAMIRGDMTLTNTVLQRQASGAAQIRIEVDRRNLNGRADSLAVDVSGLTLNDAYGHTLLNGDQVSAIHLTLDEDLQFSSGFRLKDRGLQSVGVQYDMTLPGAGERIAASGWHAVFPAADARAALELDFPQLSSRYRLEQDGGRVTVSRSHSDETAFEIRRLSAGGGILYAGGGVIGTAVIDTYNYRTCFLLLDGTDHCMAMGSNEEMATLPERQIAQTLMQ